MEGFDIVTTVGTLVDTAKEQMLGVAPYLLGALTTFAGISIGIKIFKRITSKVG